jgi:hypothetical protein
MKTSKPTFFDHLPDLTVSPTCRCRIGGQRRINGRFAVPLLLFLIFALPVNATIWRVNNNAGVTGGVSPNIIYGTINEAIDPVTNTELAPGDTIHVEGSVTPYNETVLVDKLLYIFGPGFDLTLNPETQHIKQSAKVGSITFASGSEGSVLAGIEQIEKGQMTLTKTAGSTVMGISVNFNGPSFTGNLGTWTGPILTIKASNIKVINCKLNYVLIDHSAAALENIDIRKCWFCPGVVLSASPTNPAYTVNNLNLVNNFFRNDASGTAATNSNCRVIDLHASVKANIGNNTFYGGFKINAPANCRITNNVFYAIGSKGSLNDAETNVYTGNLANVNGLGKIAIGYGSNTVILDNNTEAASNSWFAATGGIAATDNYFMAKSGGDNNSPLRAAAVTAGTTGQLGMFGGLSPFVLSGLTNIPAVYEIQMPAEVSSDGFTVTVKVKAH